MKKLQIVTSGVREVVMTRSFNAPREVGWACHTRADLVRRWLLGPRGWTMPTCEIDLRVGGRYRYVWRDAKGVEMGMGGVFRDVAAPERLVAAELFDTDWTGGETLVTQRFTESDGMTIITMTVLYSSTAAREAALKTGMSDGMEMSYAKLDTVLEIQNVLPGIR